MRCVCDTSYGGEEKCTQDFGEENWKKKPLGRLGVDWRIILNWVLKEQNWNGMAWIHVT